MAEVLPQAIQPTTIEGAEALDRPRPPHVRRKRSPLASVGLHATLVVATFCALFPIAWVLLSSFKPASEIRRSEIHLFASPTLENYRTLLTDTDFPYWFLNSVIVAAFTMVIGIAMSATAGYALSRFNFPGKRGLMWTFLLTQMFPVAILIVPIYTIMANLGLIDTKASLVIAYLTVAVPFCAWMLRGYFDTIPRELDEAAALDGLGPFATFWRVVLPLARPGIAVTAFYTFLTAWGGGGVRHRLHAEQQELHARRRPPAVRPAVQPPVGAAHRGGRPRHASPRRSSSSSPSATWSPA